MYNGWLVFSRRVLKMYMCNGWLVFSRRVLKMYMYNGWLVFSRRVLKMYMYNGWLVFSRRVLKMYMCNGWLVTESAENVHVLSHYTYSPGPSDRQTAQTGRRDLQNSKRQLATSSSKTELTAWPQGQTSKRGRLPSNTKWRRPSKHHITPRQPRRHVLVAGENKKKNVRRRGKWNK